MLDEAIVLAATAHRSQLDQVGQPYILHPLRVMLALRADNWSVEHQIVGVLHDTVEDTDVTFGVIETVFGNEIAVAVDALTRRPSETTYHEFVRRAAANSLARVVKRYDIADNLGRIDGLELVNPEKAARLGKRYKSAIRELQDRGPGS